MSQKIIRLIEDEDVRRWYENLSRGSKLTADVRLRRVRLFCKQRNMSPKDLVNIGRDDVRKLEDLLHDCVSEMESKQYAPGYIDNTIKAVKSWLSYNYIELKRKIKIANATIPVTLQDEKIPSKQELKEILNAATRRARASISLMAFAGLRPQVLGKDDGSDALRISDIPDLVVEKGAIHFKRIPAMIVVRPSLSKARHKYTTFLTSEGCNYLLGYLKSRIMERESIEPDSPVISVSKGHDRMGGRTSNSIVTTKAVTAEIREAIRSVTRARPYVLRSYFDTQLLLAESHGRIAPAYRQFFMGHKGDMESRYTTNKGRLSDEMIEDMRRAFQQSEQFLSTEEIQEKDKKELLLEMWREQAKLYGINPLKIKIEKQRDENKTLDYDDEILAIKDAIVKSREERYEGKLVSEGELVAFVEQGWDIVKELQNGKVLVRKRAY
ncbi:MAG: site-specific integrase [Nitrosotalea sp.]